MSARQAFISRRITNLNPTQISFEITDQRTIYWKRLQLYLLLYNLSACDRSGILAYWHVNLIITSELKIIIKHTNDIEWIIQVSLASNKATDWFDSTSICISALIL